tara:strand:+ start:237 stop:1064 length:828 start_codon:yes stop_codon:yes gene_type:complete
VLAKVSDNPKKIYPKLTALADYLAIRLVDQGIVRGEVKIAPDNITMSNWLRLGKVDLVSETPFSAAYLQKNSGAKPVARGWRKGVPSYHSVIFVRKDSDIQGLDDLLGKVIAFEDPGSTSAYFLPTAELLTKELPMVRMRTVREKAPGSTIGFVFSGGEINSTTWVYKQLVDAAALSNLEWESEESVPQRMKKELRIIHRTRDYPRSVELATSARPSAFIDRLAAELHRAHKDPRGLLAMEKYKSTTRFDVVDQAMSETLKTAEKMLTVIQSELK